jgi:hypothetical protein
MKRAGAVRQRQEWAEENISKQEWGEGIMKDARAGRKRQEQTGRGRSRQAAEAFMAKENISK